MEEVLQIQHQVVVYIDESLAQTLYIRTHGRLLRQTGVPQPTEHGSQSLVFLELHWGQASPELSQALLLLFA